MDDPIVDFGPEFKPLPLHKGIVRWITKEPEILSPMPEHLWGHGFVQNITPRVDVESSAVVQCF